ncbi:AfsR/SARP family transcriptional regulator [Kitasatospora sp. NPDC017646]|uniref:AfsR/SARP family transcriptional regulator n=1 Tax=Kitasatospora sp. NPDC017646 TaxID=3364024 RepID=UPI003797E756
MWFGLLGPLAVRQGDRALPLGGGKRRALLAALLFQANAVVSQRSLQNALWGEEPPATAADSLRNHVARLRLMLGAEGASRLTSTPHGVHLRVADGELDVQEFAALLARTRHARAERDWQTASRQSGAALALWRGEPLSDVPDLHGLEGEIRYLGQARLQALEWHYEAELHLGRHTEAALELTRWAAHHPLHEALHTLLVTALYRSGRQAEALEAFETVRAALAEELGVDPGPALQAIHQQVLTMAPAFPAQRAAEAEPASSGAVVPEAAEAHRTRPHNDDMSAVPVPTQLPMDTYQFTGRQNEMRQLRELLEQAANGDGPRVVTVTGMGGVGKSALAVHAAHLLRERFPNGQLHLDLRGFGTGTPRSVHEVLAILLADLHPTTSGASARAIPDDTDRRAALLRTTLADRRFLLVLDNARDSDQVLPLLPGTGRSAVIVTSRNTLTDLPAHHIPLAPMDMEEQRALLSAMCGCDRMEQDLDGALRILAACAGLPLALRIAGARLAARPAWPLTTLADRLDTGGPGRLAALRAGRMEVRATFASSYLALRDSDEQAEREAARAFRLLGLCPQHEISPASAAALLDRTPAEAEDLLERLADAHLLQTPAPLRYRLHDLLAEYAAERAHTDETARATEEAPLRLGIWYALALENVRDAMRECGQLPPRLGHTPPAPLPVFADEAEALAWCRQELPNIGEAIRQAGDGPRPDLAWRLAVWLFGYMRTYWWTGQWEEHLNQALRITEQHDDGLGRTWVLRTLGVCHGMARRLDASIQALQEALALAESEDPESSIVVRSNLSLAYSLDGQPDQALAHARAALDHHRRTGDPQQAAFFVSTLADALRTAGHHAEAEAHYREALDLWRERGDANSTAITLANLGDALRALGRRDEALTAIRESVDIFERIGNVGLVADSLVIMARTHVHFAERASARARLLQAIDLADRHHLGPWLSEAHEILGTLDKSGSGGF